LSADTIAMTRDALVDTFEVRSSRTRGQWDLCLVLLGLAAALSLLTSWSISENGWREWANYYWLALEQQRVTSSHFLPSFFIDSHATGYFYPTLLFDGDTGLAITAWLGEVFRSTWAAFLFLLYASSAASYLGTWWLGRLAGLSRRYAIVPALVIASAPYTLANLYGNGAWDEVLVTGFIPLAFASAVAIIRSNRVRVWPLVGLFGSMVIIAGANNPSLILGGEFAAVLVVAAIATFGRAAFGRRNVGHFGVVVLVCALGVAANGWYLLPDVAYSRSTTLYGVSVGLLPGGATGIYAQIGPMLHLWPFAPSPASNPDAYFQLPVLWTVWGLATALTTVRREWRYRRAAIALVGVLGLYLLYLTTYSAWRVLPQALWAVQFPFRLHTYFIFGCAALVGLGLLSIQGRRHTRWRNLALLALIGWTFAVATWQTWNSVGTPAPPWVTSPSQVTATVFPYSMQYGDQVGGFRFAGGTVLPDPSAKVLFGKPGAPETWTLPPTTGNDRINVSGAAGEREVVANVIWSPLVTVTGDARIVGRDTQDYTVIAITSPADEPWHATFEPADPPAVRIGTLATVCSLVAIVLLALTIEIRRRRHRTDRGLGDVPV
jgi:hypothetical protein